MIAVVDEEKCVGCGICISVCKYEALKLVEGVSNVDTEKCIGCGACTASCPNLAIQLNYLPLRQILARAKVLLRTTRLKEGDFNPRLLILACDWFSRRGADLGLIMKLPHASNVRVVKLTCMGSLDPIAVLEAFLNGADGVLAVGCGKDDCNFMGSCVIAEERASWLRELLEAAGLEPERFRLELIPFSEAKEELRRVVEEMLEELRQLGPLTFRNR